MAKTWYIGQSDFVLDVDRAYFPHFTILMRNRVKAKKATNVVVSGEAGVGKSMICIQMALNISPKKKGGIPRFGIDNIVFTFKEFMEQVAKSGMGVPIVFDEPSYAMGKREWYKQVNQALVKTIESFRFKVRPLFIPIINISLLDKSVRSQLVQFHVVMHDRGRGSVYEISPSQFQDKTYWNYICELNYPLLNTAECPKTTCLGCKTLSKCPLLRAQYERKKASIQETRYTQAIEDETMRESRSMTIDEIKGEAMQYIDKFFNEDKHDIDAELMRIVLKDKCGIIIGKNKALHLKKLIGYEHTQYAKNRGHG